MRLPEVVVEAFHEALGERPLSARPVGGGCIHEAGRIETPSGSYFAKWNTSAAPGMFQLEADGLGQLAQTSTVAVPNVILQTEQVLGLSWIEPTADRQRPMREAGRQLARLHEQRGRRPGAERDGYIGTLQQSNQTHEAMGWIEFFRVHRVEALTHHLQPGLRARIEGLDLERLLDEPAGGCALLHGDLWGGNIVCGADGSGWFVDPATYSGHPEVDLAMTTLFGGFPDEFYDAYQEVSGPFDREIQERMQVLNIYPLLVHVALFGGGYQTQLDAIARRFA